MTTLHTAILDDKRIAYGSETTFYVETGKGSKGSYRVRYSFKGDLAKAVFYYRCINIGNGYKKRLTMEGKVLAKAAS
jgi:hypothetical protein